MLYDPKWKRESVADLIAWLEIKPPEECYEFSLCGGCLIAQWMVGVRQDAWSAEITSIYDGQDPGRIAAGPHRAREEWTCGAALARARAHVMAQAA
jgi:hypothetical protein